MGRLRAVAERVGIGRSTGERSTVLALDADMLDVHRLTRMLQEGVAASPPAPTRVIPLARYLRPATHYQLPLPSAAAEGGESS